MLTLTVALAATLPACSGDDDTSATNDAIGTTSASSVAPTSSTTEVAAVAEAPSTSTELSVATSAAPRAADWCAVAEDLYGLTTAFRQLDAGNTAAVEISLIAILERLDVIAGLVPPHLAADLGVSAQAFEMLDAALAEVGYDVDAADLSALDARTAEIAAANDRIRAYNADECGIAVDVTGEGAP